MIAMATPSGFVPISGISVPESLVLGRLLLSYVPKVGDLHAILEEQCALKSAATFLIWEGGDGQRAF